MRAAQEVLRQRDFTPFRVPIGQRLAQGIHSEVRELGDSWVVKRVLPFWQRSGWRDKWVQDYTLLRDFLRSFIPPTGFVEGMNEQGKRTLLLIQKRVDGRSLRSLSYEELLGNTSVLEQLNEFTIEALQLHQLAKRIPDLHGSPDFFRQYDVKETENVVVEPSGKVWLVDVDMIGPLWSPNWQIGRWHILNHVAAIHRFRKRLNLDEIEQRAYVPTVTS